MSILNLTAEMRTSFRNLYADVFWYGILAGSAMAFVAIYAARIGATGFQISLLTAGPAVVNLLISVPGGRWMQSRPLIRVTFWSSIAHRLGYLFYIFLPLLLIGTGQIWTLVLITLFMSFPGTLLAISFNALFADIVPPEWRAVVVGRRNALLAFSMISTSLLCGQVLDRVIYPSNYQLVFAIGAVGAAASSFHLARLRSPKELPIRLWTLLSDHARPGMQRVVDAVRVPAGLRFLTRRGQQPYLQKDLIRSHFGKFVLACLIFYTFQFASIPIYPLFFVNELGLSDGQIGLGNAFFYTTMMLASLGLAAISSRLGHRRVLILGAMLYGLYPLLNGIATNVYLFFLASMAGGVAWAVTNGGLLNRLMELAPDEGRPAYMTLHNIALNIGILFGSLAGPLLATQMGLREFLLLNAGLRLLAGLFFILLD